MLDKQEGQLRSPTVRQSESFPMQVIQNLFEYKTTQEDTQGRLQITEVALSSTDIHGIKPN